MRQNFHIYIMHHLCTDDIQLNIPIEPKGSQSFVELVKRLSDIKAQSRFHHLPLTFTSQFSFGWRSRGRGKGQIVHQMKIFLGPHFKLRGMRIISIHWLQQQHGCPSKQKVIHFVINKDFNEKLSFVLCYIQSCVHNYGRVISNKCLQKKLLKFANVILLLTAR